METENNQEPDVDATNPGTVEEHTPTVAEAKAMFEGNPGLASVVTTEGTLHRDGSVT